MQTSQSAGLLWPVTGGDACASGPASPPHRYPSRLPDPIASLTFDRHYQPLMRAPEDGRGVRKGSSRCDRDSKYCAERATRRRSAVSFGVVIVFRTLERYFVAGALSGAVKWRWCTVTEALLWSAA